MPYHLLFAALAVLTPATRLPPGDYQRTLRSGAVERHYRIHVPFPARRGPLPVVVLLHASGTTGRRLASSTGFNAEADQRGFIAVYPDGIDGRWNDGRSETGGDDVAFVRLVLDTLPAEVRVDPERVYAVGVSSGAMLVHRLACELPGRFAAIAAVAGAMPTAVAPRCTGPQPVSLIAFNGSDDRLVVYDGGDNLLGAQQTALRWAGIDHCQADPVTVAVADRAPHDSTRVRRTDWGSCAGGARVRLYTIGGGGHSWPGASPMHVPLLGRTTRDISATRLIGAFFEAGWPPVPFAAVRKPGPA